MQEALKSYVASVNVKHKYVCDNERATEWSLIGPLFSMLGYDVADPAQWRPQYRLSQEDVVDFVILHEGRPAVLVEVKPAGAKRLDEHKPQLDRYFRTTKVKLGILTSGVEWLFFSDRKTMGIMDEEPFATWHVLNDEKPPEELLTVILKKDAYTPQFLREYIHGQHLLGDDEVSVPRPSEYPQDSKEHLTLPGTVLNGRQELRRCELERCPKIFVAERPWCLTSFKPLPHLEPRFCSNVCRSRAYQDRTGKDLP